MKPPFIDFPENILLNHTIQEKLAEIYSLVVTGNTNTPAQEKERVFQNMKNFFKQDGKHLLPSTFNNDLFDWNMLIDFNDGQGEDRLSAQCYKANINPSEGYVLCVKGSSAFRLTTSGYGINNLYVTGNRTQNGLNASFVEGAVGSGLQIARAISADNQIKIVFTEWDQSFVHSHN